VNQERLSIPEKRTQQVFMEKKLQLLLFIFKFLAMESESKYKCGAKSCRDLDSGR